MSHSTYSLRPRFTHHDNHSKTLRRSSMHNPNSSSPPVYDKPVSDDDVYDDVLGLKNTAKESKGSGRKGSEKEDKGGSDFDDLLPRFGRSRPLYNDRYTPDSGLSSELAVSVSKMTSTAIEDPFKVFESTSPRDLPSSSCLYRRLFHLTPLNNTHLRRSSSPLKTPSLFLFTHYKNPLNSNTSI
ncbi:hypothetical protein KIW84_043075 [Lathyrus oleraceus]|uniref:Uncharacterized protein n=1 Tax=Pisum sativum TaxID=3888 RepID=A0A9D4XE55_PEA|nr:hypothetical protein KIW84_043075 [Pisum sativum]